MDIKTLRLSFYKNYPIELMSDPAPQSCLSFYDYENDPDKIYLISNNNYQLNKVADPVELLTFLLNIINQP